MALFGKKAVVGLEMDSREIRAVEMTGETGTPRVIAWGKIPLPEGSVTDGQIVDPEQVKNALAELKKASGIASSDVLLGVSNQGVLVRFANFPKVDEAKQDQMIRMQAQDFLPLPLSSAVLDYAIISKDEAEQLEVLLVAARKEMISLFVSTFSATGWKLKDIDVSTLVLSRVLPPKAFRETVAVVDMAYGQTGFMINAEGNPRLVRLLPVQFKDIAKVKNCEIADILECTYTGDEELKPWLDSLTNELRSSINYFHGMQSAYKVGRVYLSGRGSRLRGLADSLSMAIGMPVELIDPIENAGIASHFEDAIVQEAADYSVCMSLALRGLEG
jgi:type IV pilus assembly protein PilM